MLNYPATQYRAAQHRDDLLHEAERERLVRMATGTAPSATRRTLERLGQHLHAFVQRKVPVAASASTASSSAS